MRLLHFFIIALLLFVGQADGLRWDQLGLNRSLPHGANITLDGGDILGQAFATEYNTIVYPDADFTTLYAIYGGNRTRISSGPISPDYNTHIIRAAMNATPENGKMLIAGGPYSMEADLNCTTGDPSYVNYYNVALPWTKNIYMTGLGRNATTLRLAPGQYSSTKRGLLIYIYCPYEDSGGDGVGTAYTNLGLEHMTLDGDVGNQTPYYHDGAGVLLVGSVRGQALFNDLEIKNSPNHGLYLGYNGGGWERNSVVRDVYSHDNWGSSQIDNTENLVVDGFISENDSWGMWTASRKALVLDGTYANSGHSIVTNVHIIGGSMAIFGYWKSRDDLSLRISDFYIDAEDIGKHGLYIQNCNNVTISDGTIVAGTGNYAASVTNSTGITFDDTELRGKRSLVVESGYRSDVKLDGCDLNASGDVFRLYGAGSTALFTGCDLHTSSASAYRINVQAGAKATLIGCHGSDNGLLYVSPSSGVLEHSGTNGLGLDDEIKNIKTYGAVGDNATDDTAAIQRAFDDMEQGDAMIVPEGRYNISSVIFDPPDDCSLLCYGNFSCYTKTATTAFTIGSSTGTSRRYNIQNLKVISEDIYWQYNRIGVKVRNVQESYIDIREVDGFEVNILARGEGGKGNAYNEYHLGLVYNGKRGLKLDTLTSGWTNENTFYGGRFSLQSGLSSYLNTTHIRLNAGSPIINNNRIYNPSFEGGAAMSIDNFAAYTLIMWPRLENSGNITLESTSYGCEVHGGRGLYQSETYGTRVVNLGTRNKVFGYDTTFLAGSSSDNATLQLKAVGSTAYEALTIIRSDNVETAHVFGNGTISSAAQGRFATGIGIGNSVAATTPGSVTKKIQVFNEAGTSIGYLAVYDGIT